MDDFIELAHENNFYLSFFILGKTLSGEDKPLLAKLLNYGNEIGNHSNNHRDMSNWEESLIRAELGYFEKRLDKALGFKYKPNLIRFPYGIGDVAPSLWNYRTAAENAGYEHIVHWDVILDTPENMLKRIQNGSIVLFHGNKKDLRIFKEILPTLLKNGYKMVTISELLGIDAVKYDMTQGK